MCSQWFLQVSVKFVWWIVRYFANRHANVHTHMTDLSNNLTTIWQRANTKRRISTCTCCFQLLFQHVSGKGFVMYSIYLISVCSNQTPRSSFFLLHNYGFYLNNPKLCYRCLPIEILLKPIISCVHLNKSVSIYLPPLLSSPCQLLLSE